MWSARKIKWQWFRKVFVIISTAIRRPRTKTPFTRAFDTPNGLDITKVKRNALRNGYRTRVFRGGDVRLFIQEGLSYHFVHCVWWRELFFWNWNAGHSSANRRCPGVWTHYAGIRSDPAVRQPNGMVVSHHSLGAKLSPILIRLQPRNRLAFH